MYWLKYLSQSILKLLANDNPYGGSNLITEFIYPYTNDGLVKLIWVIEYDEFINGQPIKTKKEFMITIQENSSVS